MYQQLLTGDVSMTFQPKNLCDTTNHFSCYDPETSLTTVSIQTTYEVCVGCFIQAAQCFKSSF